jgi:uncharacterized membrane protein HdeD (DUF308 family)
MEKLISAYKSSVKNWWMYELLGALLIAMSFIVFSRPIETFAGLIVFFVGTFFLTGILRITFALSNRDRLFGWGWYLTGGLLDIAMGALLSSRMDLALITMPLFVGFYALFSSISAMAKSFDLRSYGLKNWGWLLLAGFAGLIFSGMILFNPILGVGALLLWTSLAFLFNGIFYISLGLKFRQLNTLATDYIGKIRHA